MSLCKDHSKHCSTISKAQFPYPRDIKTDALISGKIDGIYVDRYDAYLNNKTDCYLQVLAFCPVSKETNERNTRGALTDSENNDTFMAMDNRGGIFFIPVTSVCTYTCRTRNCIPESFKKCLQELSGPKIPTYLVVDLYEEYQTFLSKNCLTECNSSLEQWVDTQHIDDYLAMIS